MGARTYGNIHQCGIREEYETENNVVQRRKTENMKLIPHYTKTYSRIELYSSNVR